MAEERKPSSSTGPVPLQRGSSIPLLHPSPAVLSSSPHPSTPLFRKSLSAMSQAQDGTFPSSFPFPFPSMTDPRFLPHQRCDGAKPACAQCVRAKKTDGCEYDDGKGKTRTQLMREHIARLEMRVKELENPEQSAPSMTLFDPHALSPYYSESSSSSSYDSPGKLSYSASASPTPFPMGDQDSRRAMSSPLTLSPSVEVDSRAWEQLNFAAVSTSVF